MYKYPIPGYILFYLDTPYYIYIYIYIYTYNIWNIDDPTNPLLPKIDIKLQICCYFFFLFCTYCFYFFIFFTCLVITSQSKRFSMFKNVYKKFVLYQITANRINSCNASTMTNRRPYITSFGY